MSQSPSKTDYRQTLTASQNMFSLYDGYSTKSTHHVFHETFRFLGFFERNFHPIYLSRDCSRKVGKTYSTFAKKIV